MQRLLRWIAPGLTLVLALSAGAATRNNDDSCDIAVAPAATLLLPFFEVNLDDPQGITTIFNVTNVGPEDRIARVTLWTDYAYPVLTFNIQLTGYDVESVNLYDVIGRGVLPPSCARAQLPEAVVEGIQHVFTEGDEPGGCDNVGAEHYDAVGYATIDLVRNCSLNSPMTDEYWTVDLAWDNVLIGDTALIESRNNSAQGSPLVHIRAIPEGGTAAERLAIASPFPRTFYAHYQPAHAPKLDARQPLPSVFATRWIDADHSPRFETYFKIWREGRRGRDATCATYDDNVVEIAEIVRFDDNENAVADLGIVHIPGPPTLEQALPATSMHSVDDDWIVPQFPSEVVHGWIYFNLDHDRTDPSSSSNWVVASIRAEGRYSVDVEAAALGNGCSPPADVSEASDGTAIIGPRP